MEAANEHPTKILKTESSSTVYENKINDGRFSNAAAFELCNNTSQFTSSTVSVDYGNIETNLNCADNIQCMKGCGDEKEPGQHLCKRKISDMTDQCHNTGHESHTDLDTSITTTQSHFPKVKTGGLTSKMKSYQQCSTSMELNVPVDGDNVKLATGYVSSNVQFSQSSSSDHNYGTVLPVSIHEEVRNFNAQRIDGIHCEAGSHEATPIHESCGDFQNTESALTVSTVIEQYETSSRAMFAETSQSSIQISSSTPGYPLPSETPEVNGAADDFHRDLDQLIVTFMKDQNIPGASVAISRAGTMLYVQTYGWASRGRRVEPHHLFRIASVSKVLTAVAVLKLYEDKQLQLRDKVFGPKGILKHYYPTPRGDRRMLKITVRQLLQHSGGWDREKAGDAVFWKHIGAEMGVPEPVDQATLIQYMMGQKLQFTPGTKYVYSNLGYVVLGRVVEHVSGMSYGEYVGQLLKSIGITRVFLGRTRKVDCDPDEVEYFACPQFQSVDSVYPNEGKTTGAYGGFAMETGDADGGWVASATDLVHFFNALDGTGPVQLLKPETFKLMLERPSYSKGSTWYGLGLDVSWYRKAWEHSGTIDGATSTLCRSRHGFTYAFLVNYWPPDSDYSNLILYAINRIPSWSCIKAAEVPPADAVTLDKKYAFKIKLPHEDFHVANNTLSNRGYQVIWLSGYNIDGHTYLNVIWTTEVHSTVLFTDLSEDNLTECIAKAKCQGQKPLHVDCYFLEDCLKYTVILQDNSTNSEWRLCSGMSLEEHEKMIHGLSLEGLTLTKQCVQVSQGKPCVLALYEAQTVGGCWAKCGLTSEKYHAEFARQARYGHMLSYVKPYEDCGTVRFSAIWSNPGPYVYTSEDNMSKYLLLNDFLIQAQKKFIPVCISGYEDEDCGGHKFIAVWAKKVATASI